VDLTPKARGRTLAWALAWALAPTSTFGCGGGAAADLDAGGELERLSQTGLYADLAAGTLADGVVEFAPEFPLWSDGDAKRRFVWLPPGETIDTSDMDDWRLPTGTRLWKSFADDALGTIETRLILRTGPAPDDVVMASYVWLPDGSDAVRAPDGAALPLDGVSACPPLDPTAADAAAAAGCHYVPAEDDCARCHDGATHRALGFQAVQLSYDADAALLDLADLVADGRLSSAPADGGYPVPGDATERAALGYLHGNCGHCHTATRSAPDEPYGLSGYDTRVTTATRTVAEAPAYATGSNTPIKFWSRDEGNTAELPCRIVPGDPDRSAVVARMSARDGWERPHTQMPPIFTTVVDPDGTGAVRAWIAALGESPSGPCAP
jgi:hypothetical protein